MCEFRLYCPMKSSSSPANRIAAIVVRQCCPRACEYSAFAYTPSPFCRTAVSKPKPRLASMVYDVFATIDRLSPRFGAKLSNERFFVIVSPAYPPAKTHSPRCRSSAGRTERTRRPLVMQPGRGPNEHLFACEQVADEIHLIQAPGFWKRVRGVLNEAAMGQRLSASGSTPTEGEDTAQRHSETACQTPCARRSFTDAEVPAV